MAYQSVKPVLSLEDVKKIYTEEIKKYKVICKKNKNNINCSKHLVMMLKEYSTLLLKQQALEQNIAPADLEFKQPNIKINII